MTAPKPRTLAQAMGATPDVLTRIRAAVARIQDRAQR